MMAALADLTDWICREAVDEEHLFGDQVTPSNGAGGGMESEIVRVTFIEQFLIDALCWESRFA